MDFGITVGDLIKVGVSSPAFVVSVKEYTDASKVITRHPVTGRLGSCSIKSDSDFVVWE